MSGVAACLLRHLLRECMCVREWVRVRVRVQCVMPPIRAADNNGLRRVSQNSDWKEINCSCLRLVCVCACV